MAEKRKILFSVIQGADGILEVDWRRDLRCVIDDDGKDTDPLIDMAEELLERLKDDEAEGATLA